MGVSPLRHDRQRNQLKLVFSREGLFQVCDSNDALLCFGGQNGRSLLDRVVFQSVRLKLGAGAHAAGDALEEGGAHVLVRLEVAVGGVANSKFFFF